MIFHTNSLHGEALNMKFSSFSKERKIVLFLNIDTRENHGSHVRNKQTKEHEISHRSLGAIPPKYEGSVLCQMGSCQHLKGKQLQLLNQKLFVWLLAVPGL